MIFLVISRVEGVGIDGAVPARPLVGIIPGVGPVLERLGSVAARK